MVRIKYERTLSLVQQGLVRITVIGQHAPDLTTWAALPPEHRAISTATRQAILQQAQEKRTAKTIVGAQTREKLQASIETLI